MKKWEEDQKKKVHNKRVNQAKPTISKNETERFMPFDRVVVEREGHS